MNESSYRDLFGEILADHHEAPRNFSILPAPAVKEQGYNPLCGDRIDLFLNVNSDHVLEKCTFQGEGCSICMASCSIMTEKVNGLKVEDALKWVEGFRQKMQGDDSSPLLPDDHSGDDLTALYGVKRFPVRIKCALLSWTTLKNGLNKIESKGAAHSS